MLTVTKVCDLAHRKLSKEDAEKLFLEMFPPDTLLHKAQK